MQLLINCYFLKDLTPALSKAEGGSYTPFNLRSNYQITKSSNYHLLK